jgi:hypoxanthine-guanine phosphoribosyltransferase
VLYLFLVEDILDTGDGAMELRDIIYHHMGLYQFVTID